MKNESFEAQVEEIIKMMDWEKIRKVMVFLDWKWVNYYNGDTAVTPPSIEHLKECGRYLLKICWEEGMAYKKNFYYHSTGGLYATYEHWDGRPVLSLFFSLEGHRFDVDESEDISTELSEDRLLEIDL